ncbi:MAG: hypothetical protein ACRYG4_09230 [Janthinobacterium lividum]
MELGSQAEWCSGLMSSLAVVVALGGYWLSGAQRNWDLKARERQAAKRVSVKLFSVLNKTHDLSRHFEAPYVGLPVEGLDSQQRWRTIQPIIGLMDDPGLQLDGEEQNMLIDAGAHEFLMQLMLAVTRYQSTVISMREYTARYDILHQMMPAVVEYKQGRASYHLSAEQVLSILPYSNALESIVINMMSLIRENVVTCDKLLLLYNPIMKKYFGDDKFPQLRTPAKQAA